MWTSFSIDIGMKINEIARCNFCNCIAPECNKLKKVGRAAPWRRRPSTRGLASATSVFKSTAWIATQFPRFYDVIENRIKNVEQRGNILSRDWSLRNVDHACRMGCWVIFRFWNKRFEFRNIRRVGTVSNPSYTHNKYQTKFQIYFQFPNLCAFVCISWSNFIIKRNYNLEVRFPILPIRTEISLLLLL